MPALRRLDASLLQRLETVLGPRGLIVAAAAVDRFGRDETEDLFFPPAAVALPESTEQVAAILRLASDCRVPVTPRGAGTGLSGGALPVHGGLVLALERMDRIGDLDRENLTLVVEAGVTTGTIHSAAEAAGLLYPPDPASSEWCQIGGNIAEDAAGPRSCKYGTTRRWIAGLEIVTADGRVLRTGGASRKNAAGFDLTQLLVGSEGTLAVVTEALLRLTHAPALTWTLAAPFPSVEDAARAVVALFARRCDPAACELLDGRSLEIVGNEMRLPSELVGAGAVLILRIEARNAEQALDDAVQLAAAMEQEGGSEALMARDSAEQRRLWAVRSRVGGAVKRHSVYKEVDAVVPRTRLAELVRVARDAARDEGLEAVCYGHAADGNLHVNLLRNSLDERTWAALRDRAEDRLIENVLALGGTISGEHGIGWVQRRHLEAAVGPVALSLMRAIKQAWDPVGLLNPGKVFPDGPSSP